MDKKELLQSRTFCMAPWVHMFVLPNGNVHPCCVSSWTTPLGNTNQSSLKEIWNHEALRDLRRKMLNGESIPGCKKCYQLESSGLWSLRKSKFNPEYERYFPVVESTGGDGSVVRFNLVYWDIRFSNTCNFLCRTCGMTSSSKFGRLYRAGDGVIEELLENIDGVAEIYFGGGEPFLIAENYRILDRLKDTGANPRLFFNTNLSVMRYQDKNIPEILNHFSDVGVSGSVDGINAQYNYIRKGGTYDRAKENRRLLKEAAPRVQFVLGPTVSIFSIWSLAELHREWFEERLIDRLEDLHLNPLVQPQYLNVQILPGEAKIYLHRKISDHIRWLQARDCSPALLDKFYQLMDWMAPEPQNKEALQKIFWVCTRKYDTARSESFAEIFPEAREFLGDVV